MLYLNFSLHFFSLANPITLPSSHYTEELTKNAFSDHLFAKSLVVYQFSSYLISYHHLTDILRKKKEVSSLYFLDTAIFLPPTPNISLLYSLSGKHKHMLISFSSPHQILSFPLPVNR